MRGGLLDSHLGRGPCESTAIMAAMITPMMLKPAPACASAAGTFSLSFMVFSFATFATVGDDASEIIP